MNRLGWPPILILTLAAGTAGCGPESREIRLGSILSLTGEGQYYGEHIKHGMDLAVDRLNRQGGVRGRPLRILYRDTGSRPEGARRAAAELFREEKVPAIIGAVLSSETLAVAPLAESERRILFSPASSSPKITEAGSFVFRNYPSDILEGAYMAEFAARELGLRRMAILSVENEYGEGLQKVFRESFQADGRRIVEVVGFPDRDPDYAGLVSRLGEIRPDGIYLIGYYREMAEFLKEIRRQGLPSAVLSVAGFHSRDLLRLAGEAADGVMFPRLSFDTDSEVPYVREFVRAYRDRFGLEPDNWAAHGYDAVLILAEGITRGGEDPDRIRRALQEMPEFHGVAGVTRFDETGDVVKYPRIYIVQDREFQLYQDYLYERTRREAS